MPSPLPSLLPYSASHTRCLCPSFGQWSPTFLWACLLSLAGALWCCAMPPCAVLSCACYAVLRCAAMCHAPQCQIASDLKPSQCRSQHCKTLLSTSHVAFPKKAFSRGFGKPKFQCNVMLGCHAMLRHAVPRCAMPRLMSGHCSAVCH